jgi:hypothetical protein
LTARKNGGRLLFVMSNEANAKRRGRPAGSNSFVKIRLCDLVALMGDQVIVPVSKVWMRENGIDTGEKPVTLSIAPATEPQEAMPKIEFNITSF